MPRSVMYPTSTSSISATPPPVAVELTFQMVRPASSCRTWSADSISRTYREPPMMGSSSDTGRRGTSTTVTRLTARTSARPWPVAHQATNASTHVMAHPNDAPPARICTEILPRTAGAGNTDTGSAAVGLVSHALPRCHANGMHEGAGEPGDEDANGHRRGAAHDGGVGPGFRLAREPVHPR